MSDLIDRAAAIDIVRSECRCGEQMDLIRELKALPSAQPETHDKRTETHACDLISRQAALDCFHDWIDRRGDVHTSDEMPEYNAIEALPSVQPEIIRCKDCTRFEKKRGCNLVEGLNVAKSDSYCSYAERRED